MSYKVATTTINGHLISVLFDEKERLIEVHPFIETNASLIGNIYVGQVKTIKSNINSAFVDIGLDQNVFVSLGESNHVHYAKKNGKNDKIVQGDHILVQIQKDAHKTKLAKAITDFSLAGKYCVLTTDKSSAYISSKIRNEARRLQLKHLLRDHLQPEYGFIARTNCEEVDDDLLLREINALVTMYTEILDKLPFRNKGQRLFTQASPHINLLNEFYDHEVEAYLYDDQKTYDQVVAYTSEHHPDMVSKLNFSTNPVTLGQTLNIEQKVLKLLHKKVWLKSGASLIIEPTEALTVIDVNTEKSLSKKNLDETIYRTNMEAAEEILYQLRARNISGIIIIDFIDMKDGKDQKRLLKKLAAIAKQDPLQTTVVGMTTLGLVEMTRKKKKASLLEQWTL